MPPDLPPLVIVLGPTGSGKSELAIEIALALGGEIVNCDSLQLYRQFDIGTAKLDPARWRGVPHHLIDAIEPAELSTAGDYAKQARAILDDIVNRGRIPVVAGGTGFYLRALLEGLFQGPSRDPGLRQRLESRERRRPGGLHRILARLDPEAAARIHANDRNKLIRALEVRILKGTAISHLFSQGRDPLTGYRAIKVGLNPPRKLLYERLDARAARMFQGGLIEEVRKILQSGVPRDAKPFESLGYKQALQLIDERATLAASLASTQLETRRYAKRQLTWFRKEPDVHWIEGFGDDPEVQTEALAIIQSAISN